MCSATWQSDYPTGPNELKHRAPNLLSFKGVPSPPSWCFRGYFHPLFINLEGITVIRAASPSHVMSEGSKFYFECSVWILTVKRNAHGFSQYYNFQNQNITMLENIGYKWADSMALLPRSHEWCLCLTRGNHSHLFRLTHSAKFLESKHTPH